MSRKAITLEYLKEYQTNPDFESRLDACDIFSDWNRGVARYRMESGDESLIETEVHDIVKNGNTPRSNSEMLELAGAYYKRGFYTDEEWKKYFIPAINKMMKHNNRFVRWYPGYLIKDKDSDKKYIVEYDYALAFGGRDYESLSLCNLDKDGNIEHSWAWGDYEDYELVDKDHTEENIEKIRAYNEGSTPPYFLSQKLSVKLYGKKSEQDPRIR